MKINKFRLIIDAKIFLSLTKNNYPRIIQNAVLCNIVGGMIEKMERENVRGMGMSQLGFFVQIDKDTPVKQIKG